MSHIATFRKKQYALSGEPDSSDEDDDNNNGIVGNELVFDDAAETTSSKGDDGELGYSGSDDDEDDLLLCVGTGSSNPHTLLSGPSSSAMPPTPPTTSTSVFDQIGASYVPPPRPVPIQRTTVNSTDQAEINSSDEEDDAEVVISKYTKLKASDIQNGDISISEALHDVGEEEDMLLLDDDDDSADDEMSRMRLADDLQAASAGMSREEVLELLDEFSVQKKQERAVKKALRAKLEEQKRFREKLKVKGNRVVPTQESQEVATSSPQQSLPLTSASSKEEAFFASDPRHKEYLDPGLAAFLADIQQGTTPGAATSVTAPPVQRIQAPITNTNITAEKVSAVVAPPKSSSPSSGVSPKPIPQTQSTKRTDTNSTADDDFYDHDVAEHRMQNQLTELLSEFGANNNQRPDAEGEGSSVSPSRLGGIGPPEISSMAVGNDFLRERRNSRVAKEGNTGAISGAIRKGSHGVFGDGATSTISSNSPSKQKNSTSSSISQHFSVARIAPVHSSHNTATTRRNTNAGSVLQITDPRVRDALPVSDHAPSSCSATSGSRNSASTSNANKMPMGGRGSSATAGRRVGSSSSSSSATFERKSSVASSMASAVPLSQQMQIKLEEEQRNHEKQRRQLEADRERRLEKKRQAERDQYGLPPITPNSGLSLGPQVLQGGLDGIGGVGARRHNALETVSVSAMPYHQRQHLAQQQEGCYDQNPKTPTPPATPNPVMAESNDARRRKNSHGQGAKGGSTTTTTTVVDPSMQSDTREDATILMLTNVLRILPAANHHAWACSSGTKGYITLKETLQNGIPGHTLLIESGDLRDVDTSKSQCCLVYVTNAWQGSMDQNNATTKCCHHLPSALTHVIVYSNVTQMPRFLVACTRLTSVDLSPLSQVKAIREDYLSGCTGLTSVDLGSLSQVTEIQRGFLMGCIGLGTIDLSPLTQVTMVRANFLSFCTGLTSLDLGPLSQITVVCAGFLYGCTGLLELDLGPLSRVTEVHVGFLMECDGLTALDLGPLSQVTKVHRGFLCGCAGLSAVDLTSLSQISEVPDEFLSRCAGLSKLDLSPLSKVTVIHGGFLEGCPKITTIDSIPPLCDHTPDGWILKETTKQWVREE